MLVTFLDFLRQSWLKILAISAAVLIPCFWHQRIEAGDLGSHTYNAWLAQLIERGQLPGLWIARQWNNVLFDVALLNLGNIVGLHTAEKIVVSAAVLIFFWGAFALVCALSRRVPWFVLPCLAMLAYGWTFEQGLINYYLSIGLAFWSMTIAHRGRGWESALAIPVGFLVWMAHPLGLPVLLCLGTYLVLAARLPLRAQVGLLALASIALAAFRVYIARHFVSTWRFSGLGFDQVMLYGVRYVPIAVSLLAFILLALRVDYRARAKSHESFAPYRLPVQMYLLSVILVSMAPREIELPRYASSVALITPRLTTACAVLLCALLGVTKPQRWHFASFAAVAAVFFLFLYLDSGTLNRMEAQAEQLQRTLPPGSRFLATIRRWPASRVMIQHTIDRACIGYCFSYGNYEPSSLQFRTRVSADNPYVLSVFDSASATERGEYVVQPRDLPVYQIYECNGSSTELCMGALKAGEKNGAPALAPQP